MRQRRMRPGSDKSHNWHNWDIQLEERMSLHNYYYYLLHTSRATQGSVIRPGRLPHRTHEACGRTCSRCSSKQRSSLGQGMQGAPRHRRRPASHLNWCWSSSSPPLDLNWHLSHLCSSSAKTLHNRAAVVDSFITPKHGTWGRNMLCALPTLSEWQIICTLQIWGPNRFVQWMLYWLCSLYANLREDSLDFKPRRSDTEKGAIIDIENISSNNKLA